MFPWNEWYQKFESDASEETFSYFVWYIRLMLSDRSTAIRSECSPSSRFRRMKGSRMSILVWVGRMFKTSRLSNVSDVSLSHVVSLFYSSISHVRSLRSVTGSRRREKSNDAKTTEWSPANFLDSRAMLRGTKFFLTCCSSSSSSRFLWWINSRFYSCTVIGAINDVRACVVCFLDAGTDHFLGVELLRVRK